MSKSNSTVTVSDQFRPKAISGVEVIKIKSKFKPRSYVLVHPLTYELEEIGIKDYFFWSELKGEKTLAQIKQDYYQKFKALPTEHINEMTYRWLGMGLIKKEKQLSSKKSVRKKTPFIKAYPMKGRWLRTLMGPLGVTFSLPAVCVMMCLALLFLIAWPVLVNGHLVFYDIFSFPEQEKSMSQLLSLEKTTTLMVLFVISFYIFAFFRLIIHFGALFKSPRYDGDKFIFGFAFLIPFFKADLSGLKIKSWEVRLVSHISSWVSPAFVSLLGFFLINEVFTGVLSDVAGSHFIEIKYIIGTMALAGLTDLIISACPFFNSALVKVLSEYAGGVNVRNLVLLYLRSHIQFMEDRNKTEFRAVLAYMTLVFIWVIFGSSFLLFTTAKFAEGITHQLTTQTRLDDQIIKYIQYSLYTPIFMAFLYMLWKLVHPYYTKMKQWAIWHIPQYMATALLIMSFGIGAVYYVLPDQFSQFFMMAVISIHFANTVKPNDHLPQWIKIGSICLLLNNVVGVTWLIKPDWYWLSSVLGVIWLFWNVSAMFSLAPKSAAWTSKVLVTSMACAGLYSTAPFMMGVPVNGSYLFMVSAGLATAMFIWTWGGGIGLYFCLDALAMLILFLVFNAQIELSQIETMFVVSMFLILFMFRGINRFSDSTINKITDFIHTELKEDEHTSIETTLSNLIAHCVGGQSVKDHQKQVKKDMFLLNSYAKWIKKWVRPEDQLKILKIGLTSVPWEQREQFDARVPDLDLTRLQQRSDLSMDKRISFLKSQLTFKGFNSHELEPLGDRLEMHVYKRDVAIVHQGQRTNNYLEIICSGQVLMQQKDMNDEVHVLAELGSGDAIRSEDLFKYSTYNYTIVCLKDTVTLRLYRNHFVQWYQSHDGYLERVMDSVKLANMIMKLSLFRDFSPSQVRLVMERLKKRMAEKGMTIIRQNEEGDEFFLLDKGEVDIIIDGKKVAQLGAGSYFGEIALLEKCKRTATVKAASRSVLYSLEQKDFENFFASGRSAQVLKNVSSTRGGRAL